MRTMERSQPLAQPRQVETHGGMSLLEAFRVALAGLMANKLRSFLTMLGVIIGVGSFVTTLALGQGAAAASREAIQRLGTNVLSVMPASQRRGGMRMGLGTSQRFRLEDAQALALVPGVGQVAPEVRGNNQTVKYQAESTVTTVFGTTPNYFDIRNITLFEGEFFTEEDLHRRSRVCVLGWDVYDALFEGGAVIDQVIKIGNHNFRVIGVASPKGAMGWRSMDDQVFIPLDTAMHRVLGRDFLSGASVQAIHEHEMHVVEERINAVMRERHRSVDAEEDPVRVFNQGDVLETAAEQSTLMTRLLAGIALVSLLVGGIGIMNIMLVSVTERTREIGIRKAIGAKKKDVLLQFLIESMTLSLVGGILGGGLGWGLSYALTEFMQWPVLLTWPPFILGFLFAATIGIVFGIYPAMKAASLHPIDALRYE